MNTSSIIFGMHAISRSTTDRVQDDRETVEFSSLDDIEPMVEVMPLSKAREAYDRMMSRKSHASAWYWLQKRSIARLDERSEAFSSREKVVRENE